MNEPIITITGNTTAAPDLRFTPSGAAVASFTVVVTPRKKDGDNWVDGEAAFYRVSAWKTLGENCAESIEKGSRVTVVGRLGQRKYEKDGVERTSVEITADEVAASMRFATVTVNKNERQRPSDNQAQYASDEEPNGSPF